jgi:hypothetical protein
MTTSVQNGVTMTSSVQDGVTLVDVTLSVHCGVTMTSSVQDGVTLVDMTSLFLHGALPARLLARDPTDPVTYVRHDTRVTSWTALRGQVSHADVIPMLLVARGWSFVHQRVETEQEEHVEEKQWHDTDDEDNDNLYGDSVTPLPFTLALFTVVVHLQYLIDDNLAFTERRVWISVDEYLSWGNRAVIWANTFTPDVIVLSLNAWNHSYKKDKWQQHPVTNVWHDNLYVSLTYSFRQAHDISSGYWWLKRMI